MRTRLTITTACVAAVLLASQALADTKANAADLTAMWQPDQVQISGEKLILVLPQRQITEQIYIAILTTGLCIGPLIEKPLDGISEIQVLNQFRAQGYVYEKGLEDCETFNNRPVGDSMTKIEILGATHLY
ncbi:hypothetical protein [Celeribacter halophilus]|uniref:hypothetical protein n=1 Tax=Celeribacter halophilus TaxID=576117 RepID=UPI003A9011C3